MSHVLRNHVALFSIFSKSFDTCVRINWIPKLMLQFCCLRVHLGTILFLRMSSVARDGKNWRGFGMEVVWCNSTGAFCRARSTSLREEYTFMAHGVTSAFWLETLTGDILFCHAAGFKYCFFRSSFKALYKTKDTSVQTLSQLITNCLTGLAYT